jgi:Uma2 family endonuclease
MTLAPRKTYTPEEYLELEVAAPEKSEYYAGEIFSMAGASLQHIQICGNLMWALKSRLRGTTCQPYGNDLRVATAQDGLYTYPDISIICGAPEVIGPPGETVTNPTALIEVLSPSTENYNRGPKFTLYQTIRTFRENLLVSQTSPYVELRSLQPNGVWALTLAHGLEANIRLDSLSIDLPLSEIYDGIAFSDPLPPSPNPAQRRSA